MSRWFRFYAETLRNPKVMRLSDKDYRLWTRLLAVAAENDGHIPATEDLKLILGMRLDHLDGGLDRLIRGGLIDALADGYEPHNWSKFQYKSDTSNERVAKHRAKGNVTVTPPDTDTDTDKKERVLKNTLSARAGFDDFWKAYPKHVAKAAAEKAWPFACKRIDAASIIAAATRYAANPPDDPRFIPHPATWLNKARFEDEEPQHDTSQRDGPLRNGGSPGQLGADRPTGRTGAVLALLAEVRAANSH